MRAVPTRSQKKQTVGPAASNSDATLVESPVTVYPIHIEYEEERWQYTSLSESKTQDERWWINSTDTDTNFWGEGTQYKWPVTGGRHTPYSHIIPQSFSRGTRSYAFSISTKYAQTYLAYYQDISKIAEEWKFGL